MRTAGLDDPGTLVEYPRSTVEELERALGLTLGGCDALASSGAASSGQTKSTYGHGIPLPALEWPGVAATGLFGSVSAGGDPKTDHASSICLVGGDPKTDHASLLTTGGDPKTDLSLGIADITPQSGELATQTATPDSPACAESAVSRAECPEHADGFSTTNFPTVPDGFTNITQDGEFRDEWAEVKSYLSGGSRIDEMNSISDNTSTVFSGDFHVGEKSEGVRQSDFGVQIVPASGSPSELSAHQMGASLAGTSRLKIEPIDSTGILDVGDAVQLTIADRALMRKYNSLGYGQGNLQQDVSYKQCIASTVSRVDGHPLRPSMSLSDRALLRKYPYTGSSSLPFYGMQSLPSSASIPVSTPFAVFPTESAKKRKRFFGKGNSKKANIGSDARDEHDRAQAGSPCGLQSKVAEPPVFHACSSSPSALTSDPPNFALLYYSLVLDDAIPLGYLREFMSLETPARRAAKRARISAVSITDSMASTALSAFRREAGRRALRLDNWRSAGNSRGYQAKKISY